MTAERENENHGGDAFKRSDTFEAQLLFSWELDLWGNLRWARSASIAEYLQSVEAQRALRMTIIAEVAQAYYELVALDTELDIVRQTLMHATGSIEKADFAALAARLGIDHSPKFIIREYIDNMPEMLAAADLVISRAGALTLAEIAAVGRASVLIPSPNVAENHQYHNAMQLQKLGAAVVVEEKELTGEKLIGIVDKLTKDPAELMLMGAKARALAQPDSLDKICENLDRLMKTTA